MSRAVLYDYFRSSASYRVRIALNLKGIDYEQRSVSLVQGAQNDPAYRALNPQGFVPTLDIDGHRLTQSLAIIVYLDQMYRDPPLMPADPADGAHVR
ncbi:MAG TPA: glutathione S-transferase N-terminal domain-containing protein, partial [Sphingomicrobium sp.]